MYNCPKERIPIITAFYHTFSYHFMPTTSFTIYGSSWCGDCYRVRRFLDKNKITYQWIDIDRDRDAEAFVIKTNSGMRSVPTIIFEDGTVLVEPSNETLAKKIGISYAR